MNGNLELPRCFFQPAQKRCVILRIPENGLPVIPALDNVVRLVGNDKSRKSGHMGIVNAPARRAGDKGDFILRRRAPQERGISNQICALTVLRHGALRNSNSPSVFVEWQEVERIVLRSKMLARILPSDGRRFA